MSSEMTNPCGTVPGFVSPRVTVSEPRSRDTSPRSPSPGPFPGPPLGPPPPLLPPPLLPPVPPPAAACASVTQSAKTKIARKDRIERIALDADLPAANIPLPHKNKIVTGPPYHRIGPIQGKLTLNAANSGRNVAGWLIVWRAHTVRFSLILQTLTRSTTPEPRCGPRG